MKHAGIALFALTASCVMSFGAEKPEEDTPDSWNEIFQGETPYRSSVSPAGFESSRQTEEACILGWDYKNYSQDCGDGGCWSLKIECNEPVFECGGNLHRCYDPEDMANCCSNMFFACPPSHPYYCSQADRRGCHKDMANCREFYLCDYRGWSCSHN